MKVSAKAMKVMHDKKGCWYAYCNGIEIRYMKWDKDKNPPKKLPNIDERAAGYSLVGEVDMVNGEFYESL